MPKIFVAFGFYYNYNVSMKEKILQIVEKHPRHYTKMVKNNTDLHKWVLENSSEEDDWKTRIYSAVHDVRTQCPSGNRLHLSRWGDGLINCGPASKCECTQKQIQASVSASKSQVSEEQQKEINRRRESTMIEKYGVAYNSQRSDIKHIWTKSKANDLAQTFLSDKNWLYEQYVTKGRILTDIADELGVYYGTVSDYAKKHGIEIRQYTNRSQVEKEIGEFVRGLNVRVETNDWNTLGNLELDLLIPDYNLAIEINGLFWHSWHPDIGTPENRTRHIEKRNQCENKGIRLIQITDWHWKHRRDICESIILSGLGMSVSVGARKTTVSRIAPQDARLFFDQNHISGFCAGKEHWALIYNNEPIMCISVGRNRFDRNSGQLELLRMATKLRHSVTGGLSKLLNHINTDIVSYVDLDWFTGEGYQASGFEWIRNTDPGYFWTDGNEIFSRYQAQKSRLKTWLANYDLNLSESANMFRNGFRRYWNCGNGVWSFSPKSK